MGTPLPLHVLIADDDPVSRFVVRATVERLGHVCTVAHDGEEALRIFERERPAALITDWRMPGLDGTALTRRVREQGADGYTYVIVLTGEADQEAARLAMEAGADDLLVKPLDAAALERQLISARRVVHMHDRLAADARVDALTGIANRRAMNEQLSVLCLRAARYGEELAIVLLDLDGFKAYNDAAGHLAGDDVLRRVAGALRGSLRESDTIFRYGGEEFLALLPAQDTDTAAIVAERLRSAVRALEVAHPAGGAVTISAGVAALDHGESARDLLCRADEALYAAKQAGRDQVLVAAHAPVAAQ